MDDYERLKIKTQDLAEALTIQQQRIMTLERIVSELTSYVGKITSKKFEGDKLNPVSSYKLPVRPYR